MLEIIVALTIVLVLLGATMTNSQSRIQRANIERTVNEMAAFADGTVSYIESMAACPATLTDLSPNFVKAASFTNVFGQAYSMSCSSGMVTIASKVPAGTAKDMTLGPIFTVVTAGGFDTLSITKRTPIGAAGRLFYDKKNH